MLQSTATDNVSVSKVVERVSIHIADAVKIHVPAAVRIGEAAGIRYLQFCQNTKGGVVNFFVHLPEGVDGSVFTDKTITARAEVNRKTVDKGRKFLYVDLTPLPEETRASQRIAITNFEPEAGEDGWKVILTPNPLRGYVVLAPVGVPIVAKAKPEGEAEDSDPILERLFRDGWMVDASDDKMVSLYRMKGDVKKTMTHHRPKH